jgi:hypothetical protein
MMLSQAMPSHVVHRAPPLLVLHLKRFERNMKGTLKKIDGPVPFPFDLDLAPYLDPKVSMSRPSRAPNVYNADKVMTGGLNRTAMLTDMTVEVHCVSIINLTGQEQRRGIRSKDRGLGAKFNRSSAQMDDGSAEACHGVHCAVIRL